MNCEKVLSRLHAYLDGEMPANRMREMAEHLDACPACRGGAERIRRVGDRLDNLPVPPLPMEFATRVMAEAQWRVPRTRRRTTFSSLGWRPVQWLFGLPVPMRLAACTTVFLACFLGISMSKEVALSGNGQATVVEAESIDGFEWFSPTPPASLGSAYLSLALVSPEDKGAQ